jgi:hypothetical protein
MIHENAAHELGGDAEKLRPVLPLDAGLIHHPQIRFMHESGGLKGMVASLPLQVLAGETAQFLVNQRHQLLGRFLITRAPPAEKFRHIWRGRVTHKRSPFAGKSNARIGRKNIFPFLARFRRCFPR